MILESGKISVEESIFSNGWPASFSGFPQNIQVPVPTNGIVWEEEVGTVARIHHTELKLRSRQFTFRYIPSTLRRFPGGGHRSGLLPKAIHCA